MWITGNLDPKEVTVGRISAPCGRAAMQWVTRAGEMALAHQVDAIATAPVNKEAASLAGYTAIGHMELLQELSGAETVATMLMTGRLRVVHLTTHRSLRRAVDYVTKDRIFSFLSWASPCGRFCRTGRISVFLYRNLSQ